jgi:hypothetical protein
VLRELLKRGTEASQIKIDPSDASVLKLLDPFADRSGNLRLDVFPIASIGISAAVRTWATD